MAFITSESCCEIAGFSVDLGFLTSLTVPGLAEKRPSVIIGEYPYDVQYALPLNWEFQAIPSLYK
jgi:hypothetical protein